MLSLVELRRAARILDERLRNSVLHRVVQPDGYRLVLVFHGSGRNEIVLLSCSPDHACVCDLQDVPPAPPVPLSFGQYLRAHLIRGRLLGLASAADDRIATFRFSTREDEYELLISLLGARSNIYLLDGQRRLVHAMRPLEETRRELVLGTPWAPAAGRVRDGGEDRWMDVPDERYLEAIERDYRRLEAARTAELLARRAEQALKKEQAFLERKATNLHEDLLEARRSEECRRHGELLKAALHRIHPGDDHVAVRDFSTGGEVTIQLDPTLSPAENLEAFFRRYRKVTRGLGLLEDQLAAVQRELDRISTLREELRSLAATPEPDPAAVGEFAARPGVRRLLHRYFPGRPAAREVPKRVAGTGVPAKLLPKRYKGEHGLEIWVGRSDEGNDYLTTRLARGNDLFFHLEGYPGSHVVLKTEGRANPPSEAVLDACELAVHFSKLKSATRADVHVAAVKDVRKPRGVKPGLVYVTRGKTVHLRRDPRRLENILASRLDD